jgi:hypothetical protein
MERQSSTLKGIDMDRTSHRLTTRLAASVAVGLLTVGLTDIPASALRLVPIDPPTAVSASEPTEDTSLLLTTGRRSMPAGTPTGPDTSAVSETGDKLLMSSGRLPHQRRA